MMKKYRKSSYIMGAERVSPGRELYNYLEDCSYITSAEKCIRLIGTVGEEWTVTIDKLVKTYTYEDGTPITPENIPEKGVFDITPIVGADADVVFAELATRQVEVTTSWGEVVKANRDGVPHGAGDYIVYANKGGKPNPNDKWVVNGLVFNNTYQEV